jgi:ketosteroid isomerase-like protein
MRSRHTCCAGVVLAAALLAGCATDGTPSRAASAATLAQSEVEEALRHYASLVLAMDHEALALLFAADADIGHVGAPPVHGRAAIKSFLAGFAGYQVLAFSIVPASTVVHSGAAFQSGAYQQRVRTPQGQVLEVAGRFEAEWHRGPSGAWLISRMSTASSP